MILQITDCLAKCYVLYSTDSRLQITDYQITDYSIVTHCYLLLVLVLRIIDYCWLLLLLLLVLHIEYRILNIRANGSR